MENKENKLLEIFFEQSKQDISDNGFSRRVIQKLPEKKNVRWIVPVFALLGMLTSLLFIDIQQMIINVYLLIAKLPLMYIAGVFFAVPFVCLAGWYYSEKQYGIFG